MNELMNIKGIKCYEQDGVAYLDLETVARGLGFTRIAESGNEVVRWERVHGYLSEIGFMPTSGHGVSQLVGKGDFIPENIFYRLAMKAKNETAEKFQALVADEIIPSIRKHGVYATSAKVEEMLNDPDTMIKLLMEFKAERNARLQLEADNSLLTVQKKIMEPKAEYFDDLVDRGVNVSIRDTAKQLGVKQNVFVNFLLAKKYLYRDKKGKLTPYAQYDNDLFVLKECFNEKTAWGGVQTLITPKGRETFRLLTEGLRE